MSFTLQIQENIAYLSFSCRLSVNLLTEKNLQELITHLGTVEQDPKLLGTILSSTKADFCYGANILYLQKLHQDPDLYSKLISLHQSLLSFKKPMVSLINGKCLGGGLELALLSAYRIGIEKSQLTFACPEVSLGIMPGLGATQRLPRAIGLQNSMELLVNLSQFDETKALETRLIHALSSPQQAIKLAIEYIKNPFTPESNVYKPHDAHRLEYAYMTALCKEKTQNCYPNVQFLLQAVYEGSLLPLKNALFIEALYFTKTLQLAYIPSLLALHIHRQSLKRTYKTQDIPTVGIIGGGFMGSAITKHALDHQCNVILVEIPQKINHCRLLFKDYPQLKITPHLQDLSNCDIVIESIPEDLILKQSVLKQIESYIPPHTLLCSNTSALPITKLSSSLQHPERFLGFHFLSPVDKVPLIEIIHHAKSHPDSLHKALCFSILLSKTPLQVKDIEGFFTTNIVLQYILTALKLYTEGIHPISIENAAKQNGMKTSPLWLLDQIGIDVAWHILKSSQQQIPPKVIELIQHLYEKNNLGRKTQKGFYHYPQKQFSSELLNRYPRATLPFNIIQEQLLSNPLRCALSLYQQGYLSKTDAQMGLIGLGFPIKYILLNETVYE